MDRRWDTENEWEEFIFDKRKDTLLFVTGPQ